VSGRSNRADLEQAVSLALAYPGHTPRELAWMLLGGSVSAGGVLLGAIEAGPQQWEKSRSLHKRLAEEKRLPNARLVERDGRYYPVAPAVRARVPLVAGGDGSARTQGRAGIEGLKQALGDS
jgi:hypothetical protein